MILWLFPLALIPNNTYEMHVWRVCVRGWVMSGSSLFSFQFRIKSYERMRKKTRLFSFQNTDSHSQFSLCNILRASILELFDINFFLLWKFQKNTFFSLVISLLHIYYLLMHFHGIFLSYALIGLLIYQIFSLIMATTWHKRALFFILSEIEKRESLLIMITYLFYSVPKLT